MTRHFVTVAAPCLAATPHPYDRLTPDVIIAAVEVARLRLRPAHPRAEQLREPRLPGRHRAGRAADRRSSTGPSAGATRRSHEEHGFALELAAAEIPVVPPLVRDGRTLFEYDGFPLRGVRASRRALAGARHAHRARVDGPLSRPHSYDRPAPALPPSRPHRHRAARARIRAISCSTTTGFRAHLETAYDSLTADLLERDPRCVRHRARACRDAPARRLSSRQRAVDGCGPALRRPRRLHDGTRDSGSVDAAVGLAPRDGRAARAPAGRLLAVRRRSIRASWC